MMFVELFAPKGALDRDRLRRVAQRLGTIQELGDGESEGEMAARSAVVFGTMLQVVVHEPEVWVASERPLDPQDPPRFLVRAHVPAPWRKDMSEALVSYATRIITEETGGDHPHGEPDVQVHVLGVSEGSIGIRGKVATSGDIVEMLSQPYEEDAARGGALRDPLCGVLVPLEETTPTLELDGELYAFCCRGCRDSFLEKRRKAGARV